MTAAGFGAAVLVFFFNLFCYADLKKIKSDCHSRTKFIAVNLKTSIVLFSQLCFMCLNIHVSNIKNFKLKSPTTPSKKDKILSAVRC